jgi:membrane protein
MAELANHRSSWLNAIEFSRGRRYALEAVAIGRASVENFLRNDDMLRASALTYTVALSIVPILALAFSALKGFGGFNQIRPLIDRYLAPGSPETANQLMSYVNHTNAAAIGTAGAAFLLFTVVSTMSNVEQAFNQIWRVTRSRSLLRKFTDYLSVLFTVPILMVAALTMTTMFKAHISRMPLVTTVMPYLMVWCGFFLLYLFFPYTHVRYAAAAVGSLIGAVLFQLGQWAYVTFQIGMANYQAIYGALAAVPIFLVWIYIAWSIVLFGAEISATIQRGPGRSALLPNSPEFADVATLHILLRLADQQFHSTRPITPGGLAVELGVDLAALTPIIERLRNLGFVVDAGGEPKASRHRLVLSRAPSVIRLSEAVGTMPTGKADAAPDPRVSQLISRLSVLHHDLLDSLTLADLMESRAPSPAAAATAKS